MSRHTVNPHRYERGGGGCKMGMPPDAMCCDEQYYCSCGARFKAATTKEEHFSRVFPEVFISKLTGGQAAAAIRLRIVKARKAAK